MVSTVLFSTKKWRLHVENIFDKELFKNYLIIFGVGRPIYKPISRQMLSELYEKFFYTPYKIGLYK